MHQQKTPSVPQAPVRHDEIVSRLLSCCVYNVASYRRTGIVGIAGPVWRLHYLVERDPRHRVRDLAAQVIGHERGFTYRIYNPEGVDVRRLRDVVERIRYSGLSSTAGQPCHRRRRHCAEGFVSVRDRPAAADCDKSSTTPKKIAALPNCGPHIENHRVTYRSSGPHKLEEQP